MSRPFSLRVARVRAQLTSIADVWLAVRMVGWALALPGLKQVVSIPRLVRLMHRAPVKSSNRPIVQSSNSRILRLSRWSARLVRWRSGGNCLERGLIAFRYLGALGAQPTLVVGLAPDGRGGMIGHAWVLLDGKPAGESDTAIAAYTPVFAFDTDGRLIDGPPTAASASVRNEKSSAPMGRAT
jgi:hypothetical protein